jgi:hypothetical protein
MLARAILLAVAISASVFPENIGPMNNSIEPTAGSVGIFTGAVTDRTIGSFPPTTFGEEGVPVRVIVVIFPSWVSCLAGAVFSFETCDMAVLRSSIYESACFNFRCVDSKAFVKGLLGGARCTKSLLAWFFGRGLAAPEKPNP